MAKITIAAVGALSALLLMSSGCVTTTSGGAVGAERKQLMLVSSQQLEQMSAEAYTKLRASAVEQGVLNTNEALLVRVRAIAARLEPQTGVFRQDAPAWQWEVNVIESDDLNAFCMPGGKIIFSLDSSIA